MENMHYIISKILILMSYGLITILILAIPIGIYSIYILIYPGTLRVVISNDNNEMRISEKDLNYDKIIELMTASSNNSNIVIKEIKPEEINAFCETCDNLQCEIKKENIIEKERCAVINKKLSHGRQKIEMMYEEFTNIKDSSFTLKERSKNA